MKQDELKAAQRPFKQRYRDDPESALLTMRAEGAIEDQGVSCSVQTGTALVEAGLHPATGGDGTLACSGEMLLQSLVACAGVTLRSVAVNRGLDVTGGTVRAEGQLDLRGTMAVDGDAPVGFRSIRLTFHIDGDHSPEEVTELIALTERYCVVLQTLAASPELSVVVD